MSDFDTIRYGEDDRPDEGLDPPPAGDPPPPHEEATSPDSSEDTGSPRAGDAANEPEDKRPPAEAVPDSEEREPPAIVLRGVGKVYGGATALHSVNLAVPRGEIFGFIGPNGAGKTTTLKILATLTRPTSGRAEICGFDCVREPTEVRKRMGYLPDGAPSASDLTVGEFLEFFASAYGLTGPRRKSVVRDVLELVDLGKKRDVLLGALSLGMRQRLGLARVLVHDPDVLLLDEPGTGLDPRARVEIREVLRELTSLDKTILISSHILGELDELCTSVGILERGKVVFAGTIEDAKARAHGGGIEVRVGGGHAEVALGLLTSYEGVQLVELEPNGLLIVGLEPGRSPSLIASRLINSGLDLTLLRPREVALEDAFLSLTDGDMG
ncbi:MAG: ABC transporter ATP-binding protein [Planctomycetes bacterium]|nr:ABC transporter ATP-binding protein [Planctomycetota bacterium]